MSEDTEAIRILLKAHDADFQRAMNRVNKSLGKLHKDANRSLSGANTAVSGNLSKMSTSIKAFVGGAIGTVLVQGIAQAVTSVRGLVQGIATIGDEAKRAGVPLQAFQEWKFVAEQNRIGVDQMVDGLKELNLRSDEFVTTGVGPAAEAFARLGMSASEVQQRLKDPSEMMLEIIDRMQKMDRAAQIRVADEVFGGTGGERFVELVDQGEAGLRSTIERAHEVGAVMNDEMVAKAAELDRRFNEIATSVSTLGKTIVVSVVDAVIETDTRLQEMFGNIEAAKAKLGNENVEILDADPRALNEHKENVKDVIDAYAELDMIWAGLTDAGGFRLMDVSDLDVAYDLASILDEIDLKMRAFDEGTISAMEFEYGITSLIEEANGLITSLDDIDAARFGGVTAALGQMAVALAQVRDRAIEAVMALPGTDVDMSQGPRTRARVTGLPSEDAPRTSPRPQSAPSDPDFGLPPIPRSGRSGGGGGGGGRSSDGWADEIASLKTEIASLTTEAQVLVDVGASGMDMGQALEFARKKAELLSKATEEGKDITPQLRAEIDALAQAYVDAQSKVDGLVDAIERQTDATQAGIDEAVTLFQGIIGGADSARAAVGRLIMKMAEIQFQNALTSWAGNGGGGILSTLGSLVTGGTSPVLTATKAVAPSAKQTSAVTKVALEMRVDPSITYQIASEAADVQVRKSEVRQAKALPEQVRKIEANPRAR